MNTLILTSLCALALNASAKPAATDTVDMYMIDNAKVEKFDGSQLVGKTIVSYDVQGRNDLRRPGDRECPKVIDFTVII